MFVVYREGLTALRKRETESKRLRGLQEKGGGEFKMFVVYREGLTALLTPPRAVERRVHVVVCARLVILPTHAHSV